MVDPRGPERDLTCFVLPAIGRLAKTDDPWEPYRLLGPDGTVVGPVAEYLKDVQASGSPATTLRSYGLDLLRWMRFLWAWDIEWDHAGRTDARDFARWMQLADKPVRPHWRREHAPTTVAGTHAGSRAARTTPGTPNPVTGKPTPGLTYAATTRAHAETVLRTFYDFHRDQGSGPVLNPFPLDRSRRSSRPNEHHNPMDEWRNERTGRYRPKVVKRIPRRIPDDHFNAVFAQLRSDRDRALLAFWVSTGARAEELISVHQGGADPGQQLITVVRKGTRESQPLPASSDAFVWLRIYQEQMHGLAPRGRNRPLWFTLRRPFRPLTYDAARAMFTRANTSLGSNWSLHDLRHTAAYRLARDPDMPLTDVQWILGHRQLTTTQTYLTPAPEEVIDRLLAHHTRQAKKAADRPLPSPPAPGYDPRSLDVLFRRDAP